MERSSGILMPIFSLPSKYGIGTLGKEAYNFIDFLAESGQKYWQTLPISPTGFGNSPYSAMSCYAGNPLFIDFDLLAEEGFLNESDYKFLEDEPNPRKVNYQKQFDHKYKILRLACNNFLATNLWELNQFIADNDFYLDNYALFYAIKEKFHGASFDYWDEKFKLADKDTLEQFRKENIDQINFYKTIQCLFSRQWFAMKKYANNKGIKIIGDTPIYSAYDSAEVWASPNNFYLDKDKKPIDVSGCPPDGYSDKGQLWGTPVYDYEYLKEDNYKYFVDKFSYLLKLYDVLRVDHFRGFDAYYAIPYGSPDATTGRWKQAPGIELFDTLKQEIGHMDIIAEDLGFLTESVRSLLKYTGFPGMKVMEFAFNSNDKWNTDYLPHTYPEHSVAYLGTHDNDTFMGWINSISKADREYAIEYLKLKKPDEYYKEALEVLYNSASYLVIVQFQDLLGTDSSGRMNTPSTLSDSNWSYRLLPGELDDKVKNYLRNLTGRSKRI